MLPPSEVRPEYPLLVAALKDEDFDLPLQYTNFRD